MENWEISESPNFLRNTWRSQHDLLKLTGGKMGTPSCCVPMHL